MTQTNETGAAKWRWTRRWLAENHPKVMKEIYDTGIEVKTAEILNEESVKFLK